MCIRDREFGVKPILVLTSLNEQGNFSNELVNILLKNKQVQNNVIAELVNAVQAKGYDGIDPVSYTHLDVYKRQGYFFAPLKFPPHHVP